VTEIRVEISNPGVPKARPRVRRPQTETRAKAGAAGSVRTRSILAESLVG